MNKVAPSWAYWEKHKHRALIALAILLSTAIAFAARNERRMFVLPNELFAFSAVPVPEPTGLRSPILGYLDDGCQPEIIAAEASFGRAVDQADCGRGRKRQDRRRDNPERDPVFPTLVPDRPPLAFFAMPDVPLLIDEMKIPRLEPEAPPAPRYTFWPGPQLSTVLPGSATEPMEPPAVPEPRVWVMMMLGLAVVGAMLRGRRPGRVGAAA